MSISSNGHRRRIARARWPGPHLRLRHPGGARRPAAGSDHRRAGHADLPDHVLRLRGHRPRRRAVRAAALRQHLHPDHEPDHRRVRGADRLARRRRRRAGGRLRPGRPVHRAGHACSDPATRSSPPTRSTAARYTQFDISFRQLGIDVVFVDPDDPENFRRAITPQDAGALRRDDRQPAHQRARHRGRRGDRARGGLPLIIDNTFASPVPLPADRVRAPTSSSTRPPSSSAGTAPPSAA